MAIKPNISTSNHPWSPWKPAICSFLLLVIGATEGGCTCNIQNKNDSAPFAFTGPDYIKQHVISRGFREISCRAENFCSILWYWRADPSSLGNPGEPYTGEPGELYPWDLGKFTIVALKDSNQTLRFNSADKTAQGNYTCIVFNGTNTIKRTTFLKVDDIFWSNPPLLLPHDLCHNLTAEPGQNATFYCRFYVGSRVGESVVYWQRPNMTLPEDALSSCGSASGDWLGIGELAEASRYTTYHQTLVYLDAKHVAGNETPSTGCRMEIFNVSHEEAYGLYCVIANNDGLWSKTVLKLSPPEEGAPRPHTGKLPWMILGSAFVLVLFSYLFWEMVALDMKLWYQTHFGHDEQNDGRVYDAYISYGWTKQDRHFVLTVIMPYLEELGYRVFVPEIHTIPSNVLLEELSRAMESSRRCIMLITPSYTVSEYSKYEVEIAADAMSSKLAQSIIPILLGVSATVDPSPLYGSDPSLSSACSSSIVSSCSTDSSAPSVLSSSSKPDKIDFNFSPLLGQLVRVLKPLKIKKKLPFKPEKYTRFLKRLKLRMPKPPGQRAVNPIVPHDVEIVSNTGNLVDNETLPDGFGNDEGIRMQELPRLYPVVPSYTKN